MKNSCFTTKTCKLSYWFHFLVYLDFEFYEILSVYMSIFFIYFIIRITRGLLALNGVHCGTVLPPIYLKSVHLRTLQTLMSMIPILEHLMLYHLLPMLLSLDCIYRSLDSHLHRAGLYFWICLLSIFPCYIIICNQINFFVFNYPVDFIHKLYLWNK